MLMLEFPENDVLSREEMKHILGGGGPFQPQCATAEDVSCTWVCGSGGNYFRGSCDSAMSACNGSPVLIGGCA